MNPYANLTGLRVGMTGTLSGIQYRVIGRVVLGTEEDGETYYWQEFNLVEDSGRSATLVFEEGEAGPEWKLFMMFDPARPVTATEAAAKRVGDLVNLEGRPVAVTFVGQSRVYHIDGQAPEGVELGDVANYFNADEGPRMVVASWTGDEIEFYRGVDVPTAAVTRAFGLATVTPPPAVGAADRADGDEGPSSSRVMGTLALAALVALVGFVAYTHWNRSRLTATPRKIATKVAALTTGATGSLAGELYQVTGHATVGIFRTGSRYDWHEYYLGDGQTNAALLVGGLNPGADEWFLFHAAAAEARLTPYQAAALRVGETVYLGGHALRIQDLFQCRVVNREGETPAVGEFGFLARSAGEVAIVRWSADAIDFQLGRPVPAKEVLSAFQSRPK